MVKMRGSESADIYMHHDVDGRLTTIMSSEAKRRYTPDLLARISETFTMLNGYYTGELN